MPLKSSPRLRNLEQWVKSVDSFALGFRWTIKEGNNEDNNEDNKEDNKEGKKER